MDNVLPKDTYVRIMEYVMGLYLVNAPQTYDGQMFVLEEMRDGKFVTPAIYNSSEVPEEILQTFKNLESYWSWEPLDDYPEEWVAQQIDNTYKSLVSLIHGIVKAQTQGADNAGV